MTSQGELQGLRVLVTRPAAQAEPLCKLIEMAGGKAVRLPALVISDPEETAQLERVLERLDTYHLAIFISVNAVNRGMAFILARHPWPDTVKLATVGAGSARALARFGLTVDYVPAHQFNSEALLALDALQEMHGKRVVIFRGNGGRDHLRDALRARGAKVDYAQVYRRTRPLVDIESILHYWQPGVLDIITVTSNETLQNLFDMAGAEGRAALRDLPLVVAGQRQADLARRLGFRHTPVIAANAGDEAMLSGIKQWVKDNAGAG